MVITVFGITILVVAYQRARQDPVLCQSLCFTNGVELSAAVPFEQSFQVLRIDEHIIVGIYRSRSTEESYGSAFTIKDSSLTDIVCLTIKGHDITRGSNP